MHCKEVFFYCRKSYILQDRSVVYFTKCYILQEVLYIALNIIYCRKCYMVQEVLYVVLSVIWCRKCYIVQEVLFIAGSITY